MAQMTAHLAETAAEPVAAPRVPAARGRLRGWVRRDARLQAIQELRGWVSPRLGVRFELENGALLLYRPDGLPFLSYVALEAQRQEATDLANQERQRADQERLRAERLAARLRALGIDPDAG